mmetsp:Transcript_13596/g.17647  ORF Transcript_13596/g.17647 Transcript_13596/m.17647 type:complete len:116 (+) Transcript_13596:295-642(+)
MLDRTNRSFNKRRFTILRSVGVRNIVFVLNSSRWIMLPSYLQYHGHSVPVVGVAKELYAEEDLNLVLLDSVLSSHAVKAISAKLKNVSAKHLVSIRITMLCFFLWAQLQQLLAVN